MFRTGRGCVGWIHFTRRGTCKGKVTWADPTHLRGNHYYLRSIQEGVAKSKYWGKSEHAAMMRGSSTLHTGSTQYYESVFDGSILQWVPQLKHRIEKLRQEKMKADGVTSDTDPMIEHDVAHIGINKRYMEHGSTSDGANKGALEQRIQERMQAAPANLKETLPMPKEHC